MNERPFPMGDIHKAMTARLMQAAPGLSESARDATVRDFQGDLEVIVERWEKQPYTDFERAADKLDPPV